MGDWPDYTRAVDIVAQTIETLGVDIEAQTLETLKVDIAAQTLAELNVNIAAQTISTLTVDIAAQTIDKLVVEVTGTASISIDAQTIYVNIKHESHLEERQIVENQGTVADGDVAENIWGKFFPHGMRGHIYRFSAFLSNATAADVDVEFGVAPWPNGPEIFTFTITAVAGDSRIQRFGSVHRWWNYDGMFIYVKSGLSADVKLAYDLGTPPDQYKLEAGVWKRFYGDDRRLWIKADMAGGTKGDLPVSGTVSTVALPSTTTAKYEVVESIGAGATETVISIKGSGRILWILAKTEIDTMGVFVYTDDVKVFEYSAYGLNDLGYTASTPGISLLKYAVGAWCYFQLLLPYEFLSKFEVKVYNPDTVAREARVTVIYTALG